jgi:hypothetical protein
MTGIEGERTQDNASKVSTYFNEQLKITSAALQAKYQHLGASVKDRKGYFEFSERPICRTLISPTLPLRLT